jgi:hypothetical protein
MPATYLTDSKHWRDKADEMRALSLMMSHLDTASIILKLAEDYDTLADRADDCALVPRKITHCS